MMNKYLSLILLSLLISEMKAQDSLIMELGGLGVGLYQSEQEGTAYILRSPAKISELRNPPELAYSQVIYCQAVNRALYGVYQVLNQKGELFYINLYGEPKSIKEIEASERVYHNCLHGQTVYRMYLQSTEDSLKVYQKILKHELPEELILAISRQEADALQFTNRETQITHRYNSRLRTEEEKALIDPTSILFQKAGKWGIWGETEAIYDQIYERNNMLVLQKGALKAYYKLQEKPNYLLLGDFQYNLAPAVRSDGTLVYFDRQGKEYPTQGLWQWYWMLSFLGGSFFDDSL
jgi:hypothetical protein